MQPSKRGLWPLEYIFYVGTMLHVCDSLFIGYIIVYDASIFAGYAERKRDAEQFMLRTFPAFFLLPLVSSLPLFADPENRDVITQHEIKKHYVELTIQGANLL